MSTTDEPLPDDDDTPDGDNQDAHRKTLDEVPPENPNTGNADGDD